MKSRTYFLSAMSSLVAFLSLTQPTRAQTISGTVSTPIGVPIPGVTVTATRTFPFQRETDTTDASGNYSIGRLLGDLDGTYNVQASRAGYTFTPASTNVTISRVGSSATVNFLTPATAPTVTTSNALNVAVTNATLWGRVRPNGTATVGWHEFGPTIDYGSRTQPVNVGSGTQIFALGNTVNGLTPATTYHFRFAASNSFGISYGEDAAFTTFSGIPIVETLDPTELGATTARVNARVNPNGAGVTVWFDLGTTTNYGNVAVAQPFGSATNFTNFSQMLLSLMPGTTYHYRAVAATSFGTNYGTDLYFTPLFTSTKSNIVNGGYGGVAWGDYDRDGRLDILTSWGVWKNTNGGFSNINVGLPYAADGSTAWADYNNDGWLDFVLSGWIFPSTTSIVTRVYRNNRDGTFSDIHAGLTRVTRSATVWGDYNNDGRPDLLLAGLNTNLHPVTQVWRNTGDGFAMDTTANLPGVAFGALAWGDSDKDGRLDILLTGSTASNSAGVQPDKAISQVWRNTGNGFSNINAGLPGVSGGNNRSAVAWGDYDGDGWLDFALAGTPNGTNLPISQVWRNTRIGFTLNTDAELTGLTDSSIAWGDYDNDGRLDILLMGTSYVFAFGSFRTEVWRNTGTGFFNINAGLVGIADGAAAWGDYDNDGRLDILAAGLSSFPNQLWKNNSLTTNRPPSAPSGLSSSFANSAMTLSWSTATDSETPASALSYNVRIGASPGGAEVVSGMAKADGWRLVPQFGNAHERLTMTIKLPSMTTPYYWSVQAIDGAFAGSPFATAEGTFKLLPVLTPVTSTEIVSGDLNGNGTVENSELQQVLANYWADNPWLQMTNPAKLGDGFFQFALTNEAVWNFSVDVTTNLTDWDFLGPAFPVYQFFDPASTNDPQRYYRLRWP
jgi:hypothetical protein